MDEVQVKRDLVKDKAKCDAATPGPWYPRATDDDMCMNARYISLDEGPGFVHDGKCGLNIGDHHDIRDAAPSERVIAISLLQYPRLVDPDQCDENTVMMAEARLGWPHAIDRAMAAEAEVERLRTWFALIHRQTEFTDRDAREADKVMCNMQTMRGFITAALKSDLWPRKEQLHA